MTAKRTSPRPATKKSAEADPPCKPCDGSGEVSTAVRVGRKRRNVGQQTGLCLNCLGSGTDPN